MVHDPIVEEGVASAPRSPARRERRDAAAHRQRILAVARDLFAREGVAAVTMHQIAQAAGIGQGTLYRRYANKGDLCRDLMHEHYERFVSELHAYLAEAMHAPALTRLDGAMMRSLHFVAEGMPLIETAFAAMMHTTRGEDCNGPPHFGHDDGPEHDPFSWLRELVMLLLTEAVTRGEIAPLDVAYTADLLLSTMNPISLHYQYSVRGYSLERIAAGLRHIFITGIHRTEAVPPPTSEG